MLISIIWGMLDRNLCGPVITMYRSSYRTKCSNWPVCRLVSSDHSNLLSSQYCISGVNINSLCCINRFTSLCKNLVRINLPLFSTALPSNRWFKSVDARTCSTYFEFLAEAFRCHVHHFLDGPSRVTSLCKNLFNWLEFLAEAFRCHVHHFQCLTGPINRQVLKMMHMTSKSFY